MSASVMISRPVDRPGAVIGYTLRPAHTRRCGREKVYEESLLDTLSYARLLEAEEIELESPQGNLLILSQGRKPAWFTPLIEDIRTSLQPPVGQHALGIEPVDLRAVKHALVLLSKAMTPQTPRPAVVPTDHGSIGLAWHTRGIDLEIEVQPDGRYWVLFEDLTNGTEWELDTGRHLKQVRDVLRELSRRPTPNLPGESPVLAAG